jgi:hypothetical protein
MKPLYQSTGGQISRALQSVSEGKGVNLRAAFSASVLVDWEKSQPTKGQEPQARLSEVVRDIDARFTDDVSTIMTLLDQELLSKSERFRTLREWASGWPFETAHALKSQARNDQTIPGYIPPFEDSASLRNANPVACVVLELSLFVLHSDWDLDMLNLSPHVLAMAYLRHTLKTTLSGPSWIG